MRYNFGIEPRPHAIFVHAAHEQIRNTVGDVKIVSPMGLVAGVVALFEELFEISVPGFEVDTTCAFTLTSLIYCDHGRIQRFQPGRNSVGFAVGGADQRSAGADPMIGDTDAPGVLRKQRYVGVLGVDSIKLIERRIQQEAGRELRSPRAGIEQGGRTGQVVQRRNQPVEVQSIGNALIDSASDAQEEVLWRLDDIPRLRMPQQITVVKSPQPEKVKEIVASAVDG